MRHMAELSPSEGRFVETQIVAVFPLPDGGLEVSTVVEQADWYTCPDPRDEDAEDAWLHGDDPITLTVVLRFQNKADRADCLAILRRWRDEKTLVLGFASEADRAVGFVQLADDGSVVESVAVRTQVPPQFDIA